MAEHVKVGILVPTYGRLNYLRDSLASALSQSHCGIDVIVIDNGADEETRSFMSSIADPRVRYVVNERNLGLPGSVNAGIRMFAEDINWCTVLCDDDLLDRHFVAAMLGAARSRSAKAVIDSRRIFIDDEGERIRVARSAPRETSAVGYLRSRNRFLRETYLTGIMFSRKAFEEIGGYPRFTTGAGTDDAFIFALSLKDRLVHAGEARSYVRIHSFAESTRPAEAVSHMRSMRDFGVFVREAAKASGRFSAPDIVRLDRMLEAYARHMDDIFWIRFVQGAPGENAEGRRNRIETSLSLLDDPDIRFTARVRLDAFILEKTGIFPESSAVYRLLWRIVKGFRVLLTDR